MGPVSLRWYEERGLTQKITKVLTEDSKITDRKAGDTIEYDEITERYSCGRIDVRGGDTGPYGDEIGVPPMRSEDWETFGAWLETFETDDMWNLKQLVLMYERFNPKIRWADEHSLPYPMQEGKDFTISKPWVGLTNEEIDDLWKTEYFHVIYELPRAIEAKLREKNGR